MLKRLNEEESGLILIFTAFLLIVLLGFAALAVDLGNAWSANRRVQTSADVAVMGGLQMLPYTFGATGAPNGVALATAEATDLISDNGGTPGAIGVDLGDGESNFSVTASATLSSPNTFAGAIGAGQFTATGGSATGEILIHQPSLDLLPLGFNNLSSPLRCLSDDPTFCDTVSTPPPSGDMSLIAMRRVETGCTDATSTMEANLADGADHLVDLTSNPPPSPLPALRDEADACFTGHALTMPNTSVLIPLNRGDFTAYLTSGLGARLGGNSTALWSELANSDPLNCNGADIAALPDIESQNAAMVDCLNNGNPQFNSGLVGHPRLVWAIDTGNGGSGVTYQGFVPVWINSIIDDTGAQSVGAPGGAFSGFTVFVLDESMLNDTLEYEPGGMDNLEFQLTN